jgi:hypothetical protein
MLSLPSATKTLLAPSLLKSSNQRDLIRVLLLEAPPGLRRQSPAVRRRMLTMRDQPAKRG